MIRTYDLYKAYSAGRLSAEQLAAVGALPHKPRFTTLGETQQLAVAAVADAALLGAEKCRTGKRLRQARRAALEVAQRIGPGFGNRDVALSQLLERMTLDTQNATQASHPQLCGWSVPIHDGHRVVIRHLADYSESPLATVADIVGSRVKATSMADPSISRYTLLTQGASWDSVVAEFPDLPPGQYALEVS
ncbi:MAG: hypothetical protein ACKVPX_09410 [Myxococcaceae bacterium]